MLTSVIFLFKLENIHVNSRLDFLEEVQPQRTHNVIYWYGNLMQNQACGHEDHHEICLKKNFD